MMKKLDGKNSLYDQCGVCCKIFYINLNEKEYYSKKYITIFDDQGVIQDFSQVRECGANFLKKKDDGSCIYLEDNRCAIHATRPGVCRVFFCKSSEEEFENMRRIIAENKKTIRD